MAKYKVAHRLDQTWIIETDDGFDWGPYEKSKEFQNYFKAKAALDSLPIERDSYNFPLNHYFIEVSN